MCSSTGYGQFSFQSINILTLSDELVLAHFPLQKYQANVIQDVKYQRRTLQEENDELRKELRVLRDRLLKYENDTHSPLIHPGNGQTQNYEKIRSMESGESPPPITPPNPETPINPIINNVDDVNTVQVQPEEQESEETLDEHNTDDEKPVDNMSELIEAETALFMENTNGDSDHEDDSTPSTPKLVEETDPFWLSVSDQIQIMDYQTIKMCIPQRDCMSDDDERWKLLLWKVPYGDFELRCSVALDAYNTGDWTDEEIDKLYAAVSKHGINKRSSWGNISEAVNRDPDDAIGKYGSLLNIPVKKLKQMSVARGL